MPLKCQNFKLRHFDTPNETWRAHADTYGPRPTTNPHQNLCKLYGNPNPKESPKRSLYQSYLILIRPKTGWHPRRMKGNEAMFLWQQCLLFAIICLGLGLLFVLVPMSELFVPKKDAKWKVKLKSQWQMSLMFARAPPDPRNSWNAMANKSLPSDISKEQLYLQELLGTCDAKVERCKGINPILMFCSDCFLKVSAPIRLL